MHELSNKRENRRIVHPTRGETRSSSIAEGPRDALCQMNSSQLLHNCTNQKSHLKRLAIGEWPWRWLKVIGNGAIRYAITLVCSGNVFMLHRFRDITTFTGYVAACDHEKSVRFDKSVENMKLHATYVFWFVCKHYDWSVSSEHLGFYF